MSRRRLQYANHLRARPSGPGQPISSSHSSCEHMRARAKKKPYMLQTRYTSASDEVLASVRAKVASTSLPHEARVPVVSQTDRCVSERASVPTKNTNAWLRRRNRVEAGGSLPRAVCRSQRAQVENPFATLDALLTSAGTRRPPARRSRPWAGWP